MSISERIEGTIENWRVKWGEALKEWAAGFISWGIELIMDITGRGLGTRLDEIIDQLAIEENIPPEIAAKAKDLWKGEGEWQALLGGAAGGTAVGSLIGSTLGPFLMLLQYTVQRQAKQYRLDPFSVITAWRRDPEKYAGLFDDLKDQGWDDDKIEALKFFTLYYPSPQDLITWQAKEVFEPAMIAKYGLTAEFENLDLSGFAKAGVDEEQARNYWIAHWQHASFNQVIEMLHRGQITEDDVWEWFRVVEIPPYWRDKLIAISWNVPTRVDVRRFWDMGTIDEARLREIYTALGYHGQDLDDYVLWTKVYVAFPDLLSRWSNGWITEADVRAELAALGMPAARIETLMQTKIKAVEGGKVDAEKALTKAEIYRGVKTGKITREEAVDLLVDLNYTETQAIYLLDTNIPPDEEEAAVQKRALTKADVLNGLKTEVITEQEAHEKLLGLRYTVDDAWFLLKIFNALVKPPTEPRDREASKADIVKAVKTGLITPEDGYLMLQDIGFTPEASQFILMVQAESSPFSPANFAEFKDLTTKYKIAIGKEEKPMPEELKTAAAEMVRLTSEVEALQRSIKEEERGLIPDQVLPEAATEKRDELRVALHRAEAELFSAKINYDGLVAKWRHGV